MSAYQGDIKSFLNQFSDNSFDHVILSRTIDQLEEPDFIITKSLQVGKRVTVGFINNGYWVNRWNSLFKGSRTINDVYPNPWYKTLPSNSFSIREFEAFCLKKNIKIEARICYSGDWKKKQTLFCNLLAGYAIYDLSLTIIKSLPNYTLWTLKHFQIQIQNRIILFSISKKSLLRLVQ